MTIIISKITPEIKVVYNSLSQTAKVFRNGKYTTGDFVTFPHDTKPEDFEKWANTQKVSLQ